MAAAHKTHRCAIPKPTVHTERISFVLAGRHVGGEWTRMFCKLKATSESNCICVVSAVTDAGVGGEVPRAKRLQGVRAPCKKRRANKKWGRLVLTGWRLRNRNSTEVYLVSLLPTWWSAVLTMYCNRHTTRHVHTWFKVQVCSWRHSAESFRMVSSTLCSFLPRHEWKCTASTCTLRGILRFSCVVYTGFRVNIVLSIAKTTPLHKRFTTFMCKKK